MDHSQHTPPPHHETPAPQRFGALSSVRDIMSTVGLLLLAPIAAIVFTAFVFQFYRVDGPSMQETLHNNDRLIVYKLPKTIAHLTKNLYIPKRGDIIVFTRHEDEGDGQPQDRQLIKRVIGLPGDRVIVKDNKVTVINTEHPDGYNPDAGTKHERSTIPTTGNLDITIPSGEVFVLGDNRPNSLDSRVFGPIQATDVVGKLVLRVLPFDPID